ncbi:MAG: helix-turn-helix transcriptional regulator [Clostridia bacterium]|nr:helix-turn-helix transcriptional regulator [Clostridia bacterium]
MEQSKEIQIILKLLNEQGKKQKDLTDYLGITQNAFTDWKSGRIKSYTKHLPKIAEFFGVSVDYLLGKEEKHSDSEVLSDKNVIRIIGRDGRRLEKRLTDEQMQALQLLIDQLPDAPDDL